VKLDLIDMKKHQEMQFELLKKKLEIAA